MTVDRRRVLLVVNTLPPRDISGVGEQALQLAAGLRRQGLEVEILGRGAGGARGPKLLFPLAVLPALRRTLRRFRPDVVQVHESDGALAALWVRRARPRPRLVASLQVSYREEMRAVRPLRLGEARPARPGWVERRFRWTKGPVQLLFGRLSARLAETVLAPSATTAGEIERDYGVTGVQVLPNVTGGLPVGSDAAPLPEPGYLLFVGRLRLRKGVDVLLEALRRSPATAGPRRLLVVGTGEHEAALRRRAEDLDPLVEVSFLGRCGRGRIRALLSGARALVVPSIYEGMPLVILEAMAAGVPVVASRVSGIPEVVVDGETGWLVPPEDPGELARVLDEVLSSPQVARRRGRAGRRRVERSFHPGEAARRWLAAVFEGEPANGYTPPDGVTSTPDRAPGTRALPRGRRKPPRKPQTAVKIRSVLPTGQLPESWRVQLPVFEGPLDLLLHLIKVNEVEITDLPVASICDQFHGYLGLMEELSLDVAGDYIYMAAYLIHLKSRMLLPQPKREDGRPDEEDPRQDLVSRLLEYRRLKEAAQTLAEVDNVRRGMWIRRSDELRQIARVGAAELDLGDLSLFDLLRTFKDVVDRFHSENREPLRLPGESYSVRQQMTRLLERLAPGRPLDLADDLRTLSCRREAIAAFLAVLELARLHLVRLHQAGRPLLLYRTTREVVAQELEAVRP